MSYQDLRIYLDRGVSRASFVNNAHRYLYSIDIRIRADISQQMLAEVLFNDSYLMEKYC